MARASPRLPDWLHCSPAYWPRDPGGWRYGSGPVPPWPARAYRESCGTARTLSTERAAGRGVADRLPAPRRKQSVAPSTLRNPQAAAPPQSGSCARAGRRSTRRTARDTRPAGSPGCGCDYLPRYQVHLSVKARDKKRVDDIVGSQIDIDRPSDGDMDFIGRGDLLIQRAFDVVDLPPPAVAGHPDLRGDGFAGARERKFGHGIEPDHEHRGQNHERNREPANQDPGLASADIHRRVLVKAAASADRRPAEQHPHDHGDDDEQNENEPAQVREVAGRGSAR